MMEKQIIEVLEYHPATSFTVISKGRVVNILFEQVTHVRKFGSDTIIYTQEREYRTKYSLQDIMNDLPVNDFFRVHKSHIISLRHIGGIKRNMIGVAGVWLPMSHYYKQQMIFGLARKLDQLMEFY